MIYALNEFELLRACNALSARWGGTHVGAIGDFSYDPEWEGGALYTGATHRNQWLISVEMIDDAVSKWGRGNVPPGEHGWYVRLGFCQTSIRRAPRGGFELAIPGNLLSMAQRVDDVLDLFSAMQGGTEDRLMAGHCWVKRMKERIEQQAPYLIRMNALVRGAALEYADGHGGIDR